MKKEKILYLVEGLTLPALLCLAGLVLLFTPDTASALVGWVVAAGLLAVGAFYLADGVLTRLDTGRKVLTGLACLIGGSWLMANPLALAAWIGRLAGLFFLIRGIVTLLEARRLGQKVTLPLIMALAGALLVLSPMITSRLVIKAFGLVMALVGVVLMVSRLDGQKRLDESDGPDIIDL